MFSLADLENQTIIGGAIVITAAIIKGSYKIRHMLKSQKFYDKKSLDDLVNYDISTQFLDLKYQMKFTKLSPNKKRALTIVCSEICDRYHEYINCIIMRINGKHSKIENFCKYEYHSKITHSITELINKRLSDSLSDKYYIKFYEVFEEFSQPFTDSLLEELKKVIDRFHENKGHNHSRLLLQILELHFSSAKIFLRYLKVNCRLLNGKLD